MERKHKIVVYLSDKELLELENLAEDNKMNRARLIRTLLCQVPIYLDFCDNVKKANEIKDKAIKVLASK